MSTQCSTRSPRTAVRWLPPGRFLPLWDHVAETANGLLFISKFSERAFCVRHPAARALPRMAHLLSTTPSEYRHADPGPSANTPRARARQPLPAQRVGDGRPQAGAGVSDDRVRRDRRRRRPRSEHHDAASRAPSNPSRMDRLIRDASVVVLPAHVEGFGLGLMHALAARKPDRRAAHRGDRGNPDGSSAKCAACNCSTATTNSSARLRKRTQGRREQRAERSRGSLVRLGRPLAEFCVALARSRTTSSRAWRSARERSDLLRRDCAVVPTKSRHGPWPTPSTPRQPASSAAAAATPMDLEELMSLEGRAFVEAAYRRLLCRAADASGLAFYVSEVESGVRSSTCCRRWQLRPKGVRRRFSSKASMR